MKPNLGPGLEEAIMNPNLRPSTVPDKLQVFMSFAKSAREESLWNYVKINKIQYYFLCNQHKEKLSYEGNKISPQYELCYIGSCFMQSTLFNFKVKGIYTYINIPSLISFIYIIVDAPFSCCTSENGVRLADRSDSRG